jgi:hypothetical protein
VEAVSGGDQLLSVGIQGPTVRHLEHSGQGRRGWDGLECRAPHPFLAPPGHRHTIWLLHHPRLAPPMSLLPALSTPTPHPSLPHVLLKSRPRSCPSGFLSVPPQWRVGRMWVVGQSPRPPPRSWMLSGVRVRPQWSPPLPPATLDVCSDGWLHGRRLPLECRSACLSTANGRPVTTDPRRGWVASGLLPQAGTSSGHSSPTTSTATS